MLRDEDLHRRLLAAFLSTNPPEDCGDIPPPVLEAPGIVRVPNYCDGQCTYQGAVIRGTPLAVIVTMDNGMRILCSSPEAAWSAFEEHSASLAG